MDSFEINKILGAVLFTLLVVMSLSIVSEAIYAPSTPAKPGFVIEVADAPAGGSSGPAVAQDPAIETLMASANAEAGATVAKKCQACHNLVEGAGAKVGPDLYNVIGRPIGSMEGFKYSDPLQKANAAGDKWTYEHLYHFLKSPKADMPGTAMGFAGLPKPEDRANIIAYLRTLSHDPAPLPEPPAAAPAPADAAPAAPAGEAAPAPAAPAGAATPAPAAPAPATPAPAAPSSEAAPAPTNATPAPAAPAP